MGEQPSVSRGAGSGVLLVHGAHRRDVPVLPAVVAAVALGVGSLLIARPLGYDAWAWMVWARELLHGELQTAGGPAFKALPVIVAAPLTPFGDVAPMVWLACMRVCALLSILVAYRAGSRLGGTLAGAAAAGLIVVGPDVFRTAVFGSSEPLLVLLVLLAADRYLAAAPRTAIVLLGVGGLVRPELWAIVAVLAVAMQVRERRLDWIVVAAAVLPPAVWLGLARAGSGTAFNSIHAARAPAVCAGCALIVRAVVTVNEHTDALGVLHRLTDAIVLPALALSVVGIVAAWRARIIRPLVVAAVAIAWLGIVAVMAQRGYPGSRRYLAGPAALLAVLAGAGLAVTVAAVHDRRGRLALAGAIAILVLVAAFPTVRSNARLISTARGEQRTKADLRKAVTLAGGARAVRAAGRPAVNPYMQTALAWDLDTPLADIQATWHSTRRAPGWSPPAIVFRGPPHDAGPRPALPPRRPVHRIGRAGVWTIFRS